MRIVSTFFWAALLLHVDLASADPEGYRDRLDRTRDGVDLVHDIVSSGVEEGLRLEIVGFLERHEQYTKERARKQGGVLFSVKVFRSDLTEQPVVDSPSLVTIVGGGSTAEAALAGPMEPGLAADPSSETLHYDPDSSGYLFASLTPGGALQYAKYFGDSARALRAKADALVRKSTPNSTAALIGVAGQGGVPVSPPATRHVDVTSTPDRRESQERRNHEQSAREQQRAAQIESYQRDQRSEEGRDIERAEHETHEFQDRSGQDSAQPPDKHGVPTDHTRSQDARERSFTPREWDGGPQRLP